MAEKIVEVVEADLFLRAQINFEKDLAALFDCFFDLVSVFGSIKVVEDNQRIGQKG